MAAILSSAIPSQLKTTTPQNAQYTGAAVTPGGSAINTVEVTNQISGQKQLEFTLANGSAADIANIILLQGVWDVDATGLRLPLPADVTFSAPNFANYAQLQVYFGTIATNSFGLTMETDNVANYLGTLTTTEMDASGKIYDVAKRLSKYRIPVGNGYSETLRLGSTDWNQIRWPASKLVLSTLKANSSITFLFDIRGWSKPVSLSDMQPDIIG